MNMEFNGARMKLSHEGDGEMVRIHQDDVLEEARHVREADKASRRRWWQFWRRPNEDAGRR